MSRCPWCAAQLIGADGGQWCRRCGAECQDLRLPWDASEVEMAVGFTGPTEDMRAFSPFNPEPLSLLFRVEQPLIAWPAPTCCFDPAPSPGGCGNCADPRP